MESESEIVRESEILFRHIN